MVLVTNPDGSTVNVPDQYVDQYISANRARVGQYSPPPPPPPKPTTQKAVVESKKMTARERIAEKKRLREEAGIYYNINTGKDKGNKSFKELPQKEKRNVLVNVDPLALAQQGILAPSENVFFKVKSDGKHSSSEHSATLEKNFKSYILTGDMGGINRYLQEIYEKEGPRAAFKERERLISMGIEHTSLEGARQAGGTGTRPQRLDKEAEQRRSARILQSGQAKLNEAMFGPQVKGELGATFDTRFPVIWTVEGKEFTSKKEAEEYSQKFVGPRKITETTSTNEKIVGYEVNGKTFQTLKEAEEYQQKISPSEDKFVGVVSMTDLLPEEKILDTKRYDNIGDAFKAGTWNALRYADAVDLGEVKRENIIDDINYYASQGLKPIVDIPLSVSNLVAGTKYKIAPSLSSTIVDVPISVALTGKTETHDPIGDYVKADPLRSVVQLPAEAALWITGGKALSFGSKVVKSVSPLGYITPQIEGKVIYRGIGLTIQKYSGKPLIGFYGKHLGIGYKPEKIPFENVGLVARTEGKLATSTGYGQRYFFYSEKALKYQVEKGYINPLSKLHAERARDLIDATQASQGRPYIGKPNPNEFKNITEKQAKYSLNWIVKQQKAGKIESIHGSQVTNVSIEPSLKAQTNQSVLKIGDIDVTPKFVKGKNMDDVADELLEDYAKHFPLEEGQTYKLGTTKLTGNVGDNKGMLLISTKGGKVKKEKVFEVVMSGVEPPPKTMGSRLSSLFKSPPSTKILDYKLPTKGIKSGKIKMESLEYQRLTQFETAFAHQKWQPWKQIMKKETGLKPLGKFEKLYTPAKARISPQEGRIVKDTARLYWESKQTALNQLKGFKPWTAKKTEKAAEKFKEVHPEIDFGEAGKIRTPIEITGKPEQPATPLLDPSKRITPTILEASRGYIPEVIKSPSVKIQEPYLKNKYTKTSQLYSKPTPIYSKKTQYSSFKKYTKSSSILSSIKSSSLQSSMKSSYKPTSSKTPSYKTPSYKTPSVKSSSKIPSLKSPSYKVPSLRSGKPTPSYRTPPSTKQSLTFPSPKIPSFTPPSLSPPSNPPSKTPSDPSITTREPTRKPPVVFFDFDLREKRRRSKKGKGKPRHDFLGSTYESSVLGFRNKELDITYKKKSITRLLGEERAKFKRTEFKPRGKSSLSKGKAQKLKDNYTLNNKKKIRLF